jgi:hypothetical protein
MKFLKIIKNEWSEPGPTFKLYNTDHKTESQHKNQAKKNNNIKL